jgi:hypothetical protein
MSKKPSEKGKQPWPRRARNIGLKHLCFLILICALILALIKLAYEIIDIVNVSVNVSKQNVIINRMEERRGIIKQMREIHEKGEKLNKEVDAMLNRIKRDKDIN